MSESKGLVRRAIDRMIEGRRQAAQRRVDAYLEGIGLTAPRDRK